MAKLKFGMIVVDGRGKLGGHVLSKNRSGSYARTKVTPVNPQTTYQAAVRALFGAISQQWSGLSVAQRNAWNEAVPEWQGTDIFGDLKQPSGKALFQRLNNQAQVGGYPAVNDAPEKLEMVEGIITAIEIDTGGDSITLTGAYAGADARVMLVGTAKVSSGTTFVKNKLRLFYSELGNAYDGSAAYTAYESRFGAVAVGDNIYVGVKYVLPNGQVSPLQVVKALVVNNS